MIGGRVPENHGLFHGAVDICLARDGAGRFGDGGAEMSGDAQVGEGDMARQLLLHDPVGQKEVWHILHGAFQSIGQGAYEVKVVIGTAAQLVKSVQNNFIALQREHAAKKENDFFPCRVFGFGYVHGMIDGRIDCQVEQIHLFPVGVKFFGEVIGMTAGVAENGIRVGQSVGVQQMKQSSRKAVRRKHLPVKTEGVVEGDKKVNHLISAAEFPCKKGQNKLRCKPDKDGVVRFCGGEQKQQIYMAQTEEVGFFVGADDAKTGGALFQQTDFLCVSDIVQSFCCDKQHIFVFY